MPQIHDDEERSGAQMIQRCAALLKLVTARNRDGLRLVDLHQAAGLARPTTHRILQALVAERLLRQDERSKRYHLGALIYEMGLAATSPYDLRDVCQPFLQSLAADTGDTVFLTIRSGFDSVCAGRAEGAYPIKAYVTDVGRHRPLNIGAGALAFLSGLSDDEIERIYQVNRERIAGAYPGFRERVMWESIRHARSHGYLVNEVIEVEGIRSIAMPVVGAHGAPVGGISVSTLKKRLTGSLLSRKVEMLRAAVEGVEAKLRSEGGGATG